MKTRLKERIIAVGGGKGGVGKSTIAASLGMCFGERKKSTLLVDADFTSSNLHTICGVSSLNVTVNDFLNNRNIPLEKAIIRVDENMWLLSGAGSLLSLSGPTFKQRERLVRALNSLQFDMTILDLPAGTGREIMDLFMVAYHRILVIEPTPLSVESAYLFLKNLLYRRLFRLFHMNSSCKSMIKEVLEHKSREVHTIHGLMDRLSLYKPNEIAMLRHENQNCRYWLIVNKVKNSNAKTVGTNFCTVSKEHLGIFVQPLMLIEDDPNVVKSLYSKESLLRLYPDTTFIQSVEKAVTTLLSDSGSE